MDTTAQRTNISLQTSDGLTLRGWLYQPNSNKETQHPAIAMAHGMTAVKEHYLDKYAEVFCAAGFVVLVWDNRHFGESDGEPRQHIDVIMQRRDYRDAITYLGLQTFVDKNRIGIWGSSLSGSHVLAVAAQDSRVKAVVSQIPGSQYWPVRSQYLLPIEKNKMQNLISRDRSQRMRGKKHMKMKVIDLEKGEAAFWNDQRSHDFFTSSEKWTNELTIASFDSLQEYDVADLVDKISPTPLLMIAVTDDQLVPVATVFKAYQKALQPKEIVIIEGDHFCPYYQEEAFDTAVNAAKDWFITHL